jgi:uncharacterized protein
MLPREPEGKIVTPVTPAVLSGLVLLLPAAAPARAADAGAIVTGPPGSTAVHLGQDVADLARHFGVALEVVPSQGGLENIEALARRPGPLLGIVPSDALDFLATFRDDPELRRAELLQAVAPLHPEEVHILARPGIATLADLRGKRVAVGAPGSGALVTATMLLGVTGIAPTEELQLGDAAAFAALREGRIDAMIHVAGLPAGLLRDNVAIEDALHLVPVDHPALRDLYPTSVIPADTYYPWQPEEVPTVAPRAVLMTLRWTQPGREEEACRLVGKIARVVADNLDRLRRVGHPKWREVDLEADPPAGWERSPCVEEALGGPESYVLDATQEATPSAALSISPGAGAAPRERPAPPPGDASAPGTCSAESNAFRRHLCEVRRQLGAGR